MQVYTVTIAETRERRLRLAAPSHAAAQDAARAVLRPRDRILDLRLWGERDRTACEAALDHLMTRDFLELDSGVTPTVQDWIEHAVVYPSANEKLALAGLRVVAGEDGHRLQIGSPACVPALAGWFRETAWAGSELLAVLALLDGARRIQCTFAGVRSRSISLPLTHVLGDLV